MGETGQWNVYPVMQVFSVLDSALGFLNKAICWCRGPTKALLKQRQIDSEPLVLDLVQMQVGAHGSSAIPTSPLKVILPDASSCDVSSAEFHFNCSTLYTNYLQCQ